MNLSGLILKLRAGRFGCYRPTGQLLPAVYHPAEQFCCASFLIDEEGVLHHQVVNDLPLGRNIDEMLRMVDALNFHEKHGEVCPAGWKEGDEGMQADAKGVSSYLAKNSDKL